MNRQMRNQRQRDAMMLSSEKNETMTPTEQSSCARVAVITSTEPEILTKQFSLEDGILNKRGGGVLVAGHASVHEVSTLEDFATLLKTLRSNQALTYGVPQAGEVGLVTRHHWEMRGKPDDPIPRTNDTFAWLDGPGIMMIDYDPQEGLPASTAQSLIRDIEGAAPGLRDVAMLSWPSASSWVQNTETGEWLKRNGGLRLYLMVSDARDIPRAGQVLFDRLWLAGHGFIKISSAGHMLLRTLVDSAVWQPSRLDFASGAQCEWPLVQDRGEPTLSKGTQTPVDTRLAIPDLTSAEKKRLHHVQTEKRAIATEEANAAKEAWLQSRALQMVGPDATEEQIARARTQASSVLQTRQLSGKFPIEVKIDGHIETVSVEDILADPRRFDRLSTRDPIEPDYDGGRMMGKLFLDGPTKNLHSFAHGEVTYQLTDEVTEIVLNQVTLADTVVATLDVLRAHDAFYDHGDELVYHDAGRLHPLSEHALNQALGGVVQYVSIDKKSQRNKVDPPPNLAKRIIAIGPRRRLTPLIAVITAPILRPDGSILDQAGYDAATQLYLYNAPGAAIAQVLEAPSADECKNALDVLWHPFKEFPFVDALDRGVMLAALLTATTRAVLPTAPAFGFDAPVQGSGKSLLASCVAALAGEKTPSVYPHTLDEAEIRKRLLTVLRSGASALVWDNVLGEFDSPAIAALLTGESYTDRVLGVSQSMTFPNRVLFAITGNNLALKGDMTRRVLVARIDPETAAPHAREFELDPLTYVKERRLDLVVAALTLMRGWLTSGVQPAKGRMASFEAWNDLVRNTVAWAGTMIGPGYYEDPMAAVQRALSDDPERADLSTLLNALEENFGAGFRFRTKDVMDKIARFKEPSMGRAVLANTAEFRLYEALVTFNANTVKTSAALGKALKYRKDRIVDGRVLHQTEDKHLKTSLWQVDHVDCG